MEKRNPTRHQMTRRAAAHDYTRPGLYHITMHVAEALGQPLGAVVGNLSAPDGNADAPRTLLSAVGKMVEHELLTTIHAHYPMVTIHDYAIMPEHLHFIAAVQDKILSTNGKVQSLGHVIAGFKKGCNRLFWEMTGQAQAATNGGQTTDHTARAGAASAATAPSGSPAGYKVPSEGSTGRQPLFAPGFCDVMPVDAAQLATQRAYIKGNPRSRLLRMSNRSWLTVSRGSITTALTPAALRGYLQRECPPHLAMPETLAAIEGRLLITAGGQTADHTAQAGAASAATAPSGSPAGKSLIVCDSFGNRALLTEHRCLPVVCHRKDTARFGEQKHQCLEEAAQGAVLISACISPKEREIIHETVIHGFPVITIHDNGFTDRYHPSEECLSLCAESKQLFITPWRYQYRPKEKNITVPECKTMNCVVQALCHTRDDWWK